MRDEFLRKRTLGCIIIVVVVLSLLGVGVWWMISHNSNPSVSSENGTSINLPFPLGDTTPEHVVQVLGSQEAYDKLWNSSLIEIRDVSGPEDKLPIMEKIDMFIGYDGGGACVGVCMAGEIKELDLSAGKMVLKNGEEEISLSITSLTEMYTYDGPNQGPRYISMEELKIGDWLKHVFVLIKASQPEVRGIYIY